MPHPLTGSSRRESYTYAPTSRMTCTFLAPGTDDPDEMIAGVKEGLYAKSLGGGSVNPLTGEFNFAVNEGYWIRDGKILTSVRGATLVGKGSDVLMKIDRVGPNYVDDAGCVRFGIRRGAGEYRTAAHPRFVHDRRRKGGRY